jgi:hypothetical protein
MDMVPADDASLRANPMDIDRRRYCPRDRNDCAGAT